MLSYTYLRKYPSSFKNLAGISVKEFDELFERFEPLWGEAEQKRLDWPQRQRAIGGGRRYGLDLRSQLLMTLLWLHLYLNMETLGFLFGIHKSAISRNSRRVLKVLRQLGEASLWWHEPPSKSQGRDLQAAQKACPDLLSVLDVMETAIERPQDPAQQNAHFSGKKKAHTRKTGIIVNEQGLLRGVTRSRPGRCHDLTVFRESGLLALLPVQTVKVADKAFDGLHHDLPEHEVVTPHKARRNHKLEEAEKWANRDVSRQRMVVENAICELKHFKVLVDRFRQAWERLEDAIRAIVALVNPRIAQRLAASGLG
jgi:transposase